MDQPPIRIYQSMNSELLIGLLENLNASTDFLKVLEEVFSIVEHYYTFRLMCHGGILFKIIICNGNGQSISLVRSDISCLISL